MDSNAAEEAIQNMEQIHYQMRNHPTFDVNLFDYIFWCAVLVMFFEPFHRCIVGVKESNAILSRFFKRHLAFLVYCLLSYSYSVFAFFIFHKAVGLQPQIRDLQKNEALLIGYIFVLSGIFIKLYVYMTTSVTTIMGGHYFKMETLPRKLSSLAYDPYYHPLGTSSVVTYFGYSIVRASSSGIVLTITLGVAYIISSQLERYHVFKGKKQQLQQHTFSPNSSPSSIEGDYMAALGRDDEDKED